MSDNERPFMPERRLNLGPSPNAPHPPPFSPRSGEKGERAAVGRAPSPGSTGEGVGGEGRLGGTEGDRWREALPVIADRLRKIGYDIASSQSGVPPGESIVARRDLGDRAVLLAIDAGGRFRAEITWVVGEWPSRDAIAGVAVRVVDTVSRIVTVTGQLAGPEQVVAMVNGLGTIASWAGVAGSEALPPPS